jgi:hypothetical protein
MASARDRTSTSAKPATASLASVNGPSVTVISSPTEVTRTPPASRPPVASSTPAAVSSSMNLPISAYSFSSAGWSEGFDIIR